MDIELAELIMSGVALALASLGGWVSYKEYKRKGRLQTMRAVNEARLRLCEEVAVAATAFEWVNEKKDFDEAFRKFTILKHGRALALLDEGVLEEMVKLNNVLVEFISEPPEDNFNAKIRAAINNQPFAVVHACRRSLCLAFEDESEGRLSAMKPDYGMEWASVYKHLTAI